MLNHSRVLTDLGGILSDSAWPLQTLLCLCNPPGSANPSLPLQIVLYLCKPWSLQTLLCVTSSNTNRDLLCMTSGNRFGCSCILCRFWCGNYCVGYLFRGEILCQFFVSRGCFISIYSLFRFFVLCIIFYFCFKFFIFYFLFLFLFYYIILYFTYYCFFYILFFIYFCFVLLFIYFCFVLFYIFNFNLIKDASLYFYLLFMVLRLYNVIIDIRYMFENDYFWVDI